MIELQTTSEGIILPVHAQPGARKNGITGIHAGRLKVAVTQAPEKGKANQALLKLLAELLGIKRSQITLAAGETSSQKKFLITGVDLAMLQRRLSALSPPFARGGRGGAGDAVIQLSVPANPRTHLRGPILIESVSAVARQRDGEVC